MKAKSKKFESYVMRAKKKQETEKCMDGSHKEMKKSAVAKVYEPWQIEDACNTLTRAEQIKTDKDLMSLVSEYAKEKKKALNAAIKGSSMKKSKEQLVTEYTDKVFKGEMTLEDVEKALAAGHEAPAAAPAETKVVEPVPVPAAPAAASSTETPAPAAAAPIAPKFSENLFKPYSLGSTLKQGPVGNVMTNVKPSKLDYEKTYNESFKNIRVTKEIKE